MLFPKKGELVESTDALDTIGPKHGNYYIVSGEAYKHFDTMLGLRTVFLAEPVQINGQTMYLDVKGYGMDGKDLFPNLHDEGDLFFGMYLENARKEFEIPRHLQSLGINNVQTPVAYFRYPHQYLNQYMAAGFESLIYARLQIGLHQKRIIKAIKNMDHEFQNMEDEEIERNSSFISRIAKAKFLGAVTKGPEKLAKFAEKYDLYNEVAGLLQGKEVGFAIRAVKSPIRVGDPSDPGIDTQSNRQIAKGIGTTVRQMLDLGYFDTYASTGNWTTEAELVDFEDVLILPQERDKLDADIKFRKSATFVSYIHTKFGKLNLGVLKDPFNEGFMGRPSSTYEATTTAIEIMKSKGMI